MSDGKKYKKRSHLLVVCGGVCRVVRSLPVGVRDGRRVLRQMSLPFGSWGLRTQRRSTFLHPSCDPVKTLTLQILDAFCRRPHRLRADEDPSGDQSRCRGTVSPSALRVGCRSGYDPTRRRRGRVS